MEPDGAMNLHKLMASISALAHDHHQQKSWVLSGFGKFQSQLSTRLNCIKPYTVRLALHPLSQTPITALDLISDDSIRSRSYYLQNIPSSSECVRGYLTATDFTASVH